MTRQSLLTVGKGVQGHARRGMVLLMTGGLYCALALFNGCSTPNPPVSSLDAVQPKTIALDQAQERIPDADETVTVVMDAVYQARKRYRGFTFLRLLQLRGYDPAAASWGTVVQFLCRDGYNPFASLESLVNEGAFLATGDLDAPTGETWIPFAYGSTRRDPGQFYLVWPKANSPADRHPWPYGVNMLRIGTPETLLGPALPKSARFQQGFNRFRENCMMCHSLNGVGGTIGIDLNLPRNVFEYWQADKLPAMVAKPSSFRRNAKMPDFDRLGPQAIAEILDYIKHMKAYKAYPVP